MAERRLNHNSCGVLEMLCSRSLCCFAKKTTDKEHARTVGIEADEQPSFLRGWIQRFAITQRCLIGEKVVGLCDRVVLNNQVRHTVTTSYYLKNGRRRLSLLLRQTQLLREIACRHPWCDTVSWRQHCGKLKNVVMSMGESENGRDQMKVMLWVENIVEQRRKTQWE